MCGCFPSCFKLKVVCFFTSLKCLTHTSTPKSMDEVAVEVMKAKKAIDLFQTMAIMNLNMGKLTLEVNVQ